MKKSARKLAQILAIFYIFDILGILYDIPKIPHNPEESAGILYVGCTLLTRNVKKSLGKMAR